MSENNDRYEVVEVHDDDGVVVNITRRRETGHLSFRFLKEYEARGQVKTTAYLGRRHIPAILRLTKLVGERIDILTDREKVLRARWNA